jgi:two-component system chemotaxis sensor kinase CheA
MDDLLPDFIEETAEHLAGMDSALDRLTADPNDGAALRAIFRFLHTTKGASGFLTLPRVEALAHSGESLLAAIRDGKVACGPALPAVRMCIDAIRRLLSILASEGVEPDGDDSGLHSRIAAAARGEVIELRASNAAFAEVQQVAPMADEAARVRVPTPVIERLQAAAAALTEAQNALLVLAAARPDPLLAPHLARLSAIASDLRESALDAACEPVGDSWRAAPRLIEGLAAELHKPIGLRCEGGEILVQRWMVERLKDSILHMVRNSADHGLENPETRVAAGKPEKGVIDLRAWRDGSMLRIEIADDGAGLSAERIRKKAVEQGLIDAERAAALPDHEIYPFIFAPGFSTAAAVTLVSGRGVGMDAVRANVDALGGDIAIKSVTGKGASFIISVPAPADLPLPAMAPPASEEAAIGLIVFRAGAAPKALPLSALSRLEEIDAAEFEESGHPGRRILRRGGAMTPIAHAGEHGLFRTDGAQPVLMFEAGGRRAGLAVDAVIDIVYETLRIALPSEQPGVAGIALVRGALTEILDPDAHLRRADPAWGAAGPVRPRALAICANPFFQSALPGLLDAAGYDAIVLPSIAAAEAAAAKGLFDVLLIDSTQGAALEVARSGGSPLAHLPVVALDSDPTTWGEKLKSPLKATA